MAEQGAHVRGNNIVGDRERLSDDVIKVLAAIKFSPGSLSREEIAGKVNMQGQDIERHIKLLLTYNLIKFNSKFPQFPEQGYKVFTEPDKHHYIISVLRRHNYPIPTDEGARNLLGDYMPRGMDLEIPGKQPDRGAAYVQGVPIIEDLDYRKEALSTIRKWKAEQKPFEPKEYSNEAVESKKEKWRLIVKQLSAVYEIEEPRIIFGKFTQQSWYRDGSSYEDDEGRSSSYNPGTNTLFFTGKFSVVTLLHEFAHARGMDERDSIIWSVNLIKREFSFVYSKLRNLDDSHVLLRQEPPRTEFSRNSNSPPIE